MDRNLLILILLIPQLALGTVSISIAQNADSTLTRHLAQRLRRHLESKGVSVAEGLQKNGDAQVDLAWDNIESVYQFFKNENGIALKKLDKDGNSNVLTQGLTFSNHQSFETRVGLPVPFKLPVPVAEPVKSEGPQWYNNKTLWVVVGAAALATSGGIFLLKRQGESPKTAFQLEIE